MLTPNKIQQFLRGMPWARSGEIDINRKGRTLVVRVVAIARLHNGDTHAIRVAWQGESDDTEAVFPELAREANRIYAGLAEQSV